jgi:hypothetical protein
LYTQLWPIQRKKSPFRRTICQIIYRLADLREKLLKIQ